MNTFTSKDIAKAANKIAEYTGKKSAALCEADAKLGDGDLGITVATGWREIADHADEFPEDVGLVFMACAKCFQRVSSSSFGTLMATGLMSAAKVCKGYKNIEYSEISGLVSDALDKIKARGKGHLGDKSLLDSLHAIATQTKGLDDPKAIMHSAENAAANTIASFRSRPNKLGRARMFGDKSIGLDDPGQLAILETIKSLSG